MAGTHALLLDEALLSACLHRQFRSWEHQIGGEAHTGQAQGAWQQKRSLGCHTLRGGFRSTPVVVVVQLRLLGISTTGRRYGSRTLYGWSRASLTWYGAWQLDRCFDHQGSEL